MPYGTVKVDNITTSTQTVSVDGLAPKASPALTGTPTAPTAAADTTSTQIATTAFVTGQASSASPAMNGAAAVGTSVKYARADHVHPSDTSKANLNSPALTGTPTAPTASAGTNSTQIATTAYVKSQGYATAASPTFTTNINLSAQAPVRLFDSDSSNWVALKAPATVASNVTWTLPGADGSANQVLRTDGSGQLGWVTLTTGASLGVALALG